MSSDPGRFADDRGRTDWLAWHDAYAWPSSSLSARLEVVRRRLVEVLAKLPDDATLLSLCSGDGRDVLEVRRRRVAWTGQVVLVELDPELARRAMDAADGLGIEVRCADASDRSVFEDVVPVDVLMLCGILGNVDPDEVRDLVDRTASLVVDGGHVVWTRGGGSPDRRPEVRAAFRRSGFEEVAFDGPPHRFGVGVSRRRRRPAVPWDGAEPLFRFVR